MQPAAEGSAANGHRLRRGVTERTEWTEWTEWTRWTDEREKAGEVLRTLVRGVPRSPWEHPGLEEAGDSAGNSSKRPSLSLRALRVSLVR